MSAEVKGEGALAPRLERLRSLRSAWGVLAPAGIGHSAEEIAEAGRLLTDHLSRSVKQDGDPIPAELAEIDGLLREFEASIRRVATGLKVAQLRSTLPHRHSSDRRGLLDLLDVLIGEDGAREASGSLPIGAIDYLVTLLCTRPDGVVSDDPVTLTPRLQRLCAAAEETDDPRAGDVESEALRCVARAARRRAEGGTPEPNPVDRIAWALDFDYLDDTERKALRSQDLATESDPLGTAILIGLLSRSLAVHRAARKLRLGANRRERKRE